MFGVGSFDIRGFVPAFCQSIANAVPWDQRKDNEPWTTAVYASLVKEGVGRGYLVRVTSKFKERVEPLLKAPGGHPGRFEQVGSVDWREYLVDVVWQRAAANYDIVLAVESEWGGSGDVIWDFQKLLNLRAAVKLTIYWTGPEEQDGEQIRSRIVQLMSSQHFSQHVEDEQYVLLEFAWRDQEAGGFTTRCYYYRIPFGGAVEAVDFEDLVDVRFIGRVSHSP